MSTTRFPAALDSELPLAAGTVNAPPADPATLAVQTKLGIGADTPTSGNVLTGSSTAGQSEWTTPTPATIGLAASVAELDILDGVTSTAAELNILDGVTSTAAELNILDGVTSTAAELNILDGVTATAAELNNAADVSAMAAVAANGATLAVVAATHAGKVIQFGKTDGCIVTLPAATGTGIEYDFVIGITATSNANIIKVANATDVMDGSIMVQQDTDVDGTHAVWRADVGDDTITLAGAATTGGIVGGRIKCVDYKSGFWSCQGWTQSGGGAEATPFSATVS